MSLLTIGEFAKISRLSPKALRLYDELGLLPPARVDPRSGYRFYEPAQLQRARLVAWLRRIGMPLARVKAVCELDGPAAAKEVAAFWSQIEADTRARRDLARFLIEELTRKETTMTGQQPALGIRYAARTDTGRIRPSNQDAAYAGARLLAVADGFGGAGDSASAAAIDALKPLEAEVPAGELLNALDRAVHEADDTLRGIAAQQGGEIGTTLTAMLLSGSRLALVHIGDSRAYLLRDGELFQITHDHTMVQSMLDEGRLTAEEAASHPQRALLLRALQGAGEIAPDLQLRDAEPGDRYLLCSDGLSTVVAESDLRQVLSGVAEPQAVVHRLVELANRAGGPDNVSCVVADVVPAGELASA